MLKKSLIALVILLCLVGIVGGIVGYRLNEQYGWIAAGPVSHDTLASADTRLRLKVDSLRLGDALKHYMPEDTPLPKWLPWDLGSLIPKVLPREIALLGGTDFRDNLFRITLFVNEQRGGPYIPSFLNTQTNFKVSIPAIHWEEPGFTLKKRGVLTANGYLELPDSMESTLLEGWPEETDTEPLLLIGGHLAEGAIDNRNGDIVTVIAACAPMWNTSLDQLKENPQFTAALDLLIQVFNIRLAIDFKDPDTVVVQLLINADPEVRGRLEFLGPLLLPAMAQEIKRTQGLDLESNCSWVEADNTYKVDITIRGVEKKLKDSFKGLGGTVAPPESAAPVAGRREAQ